MTSLAVLIPFKSSGPKSRLSAVLSEGERQEFAFLLLSELLAALGRARLLPVSHVISSDPEALAVAERSGADAVAEARDSGVNSAVVLGIEAAEPADDILVLPADLPLIGRSHIRHLLAMKSSIRGTVIVPSLSFDGTNALLFSRRKGPDLSYDADSFWGHLGSAARKGTPCCVSCVHEVMFDVDSPRDLELLARSKSDRPPAEFARRALR